MRTEKSIRTTPFHSLLVVAVILVLGVPTGAAAKWTRLQTENFLFLGDASEPRIRQVAQRLEQFREVMSRLLPAAAVTASAPTMVFVFQNDQSLAPYRPQFEGRPVEVAGYFVSRPDANYVTINAGAEQAALRIIYHEYAHFLVRNTTGEMPLWANEGLAGVYETFEDRNGGKGAIIGRAHADHLALLKNTPLMPLRELMAVDHGSTVYNEGSRRGVFYAESWALMHYLMMGNPARAAQLQDYLVRVKNGSEAEQAFTAAFGVDSDKLQRELYEYIRNFSFPALQVTFDERVSGAAAGRGETMADVDAGAYLGELLSAVDRTDEALARLKKLVENHPTSARAAAALGRLHFTANNIDDALPLLEHAATLDPADVGVQRAWGRALFARTRDRLEEDAVAAATVNKARVVLSRAIELSPGDADTIAMLGRVEADVADYARATALFERVLSLDPSREPVRLMLANSLVRQQEYARATTHLGPLLAGSKDLRIKEAARDLLGFIGTQRMGGGDASAPAGAVAAASAPSAAPAAARPAVPGGRFVPQLRPVEAGERRVLGMFTNVDCRPGSIVLVIEADGRTLRIAVEDFAKVTFITYRGTIPDPVNCGPVRPASRVLATFGDAAAATAASGVDGDARAIELLPDDFTPQ